VQTDHPLSFMTGWFADHCDGDWEHDLGIRLATLDNPGWALDVSIGDTELAGAATEWHRNDKSDLEWLHWRSTGEMFEARCGVADLPRALEAFRMFAEQRAQPV
jgi:hypothetical protein